MKFQAALFDFDGTITEKGAHSPSPAMQKDLIDLARKMPIGFCTGRQLASFLRSGMDFLIAATADEERDRIFSNIFLMAENGAIGHFYNSESRIFEEFYRVKWPEAILPKEELKQRLSKLIDTFGEIMEGAHEECIVMRSKFHSTDEIESVYECSEKIYDAVTSYFKGRLPNYEDYVHIGNSGIGVIIGPADGDKDNGARRFGEYLVAERGMKFEEHFRDILLVGDRAHSSGNDHYFLNGRYGTPYTVGSYNSGWKFPLPVLDEKGDRLLHESGTRALLKNLSS